MKTGGFEKWEKVSRGKRTDWADWNGLNVTLLQSSINFLLSLKVI
jgi:hypothetical protein